MIELQSGNFHLIDSQPAKSNIRRLKLQHFTFLFDSVKSCLDPLLLRIVGLNTMKRSSRWLTALPIQEQGFYLNKQEFCDAL